MNHWTVDWDVATIIEALEELYPLQAEHKHLELGSRWQQVIDNSVRSLYLKHIFDVLFNPEFKIFFIWTIWSKYAGILFMSGVAEHRP